MESNEALMKSKWSDAVANDPRHRPQTLSKPASTVRREWARWPQEAHILDESNNKYRRLTSQEVAIIQGFEPTWMDVPGLSEKEKIQALGNAVPPPLARAIFRGISKVWEWENKSIIEICAGVGGLAQGVSELSDFRHEALIEYWEPACNVLRQKSEWSQDIVFCEDVRQFDFSAYNGRIGILAGGPPCQPWSQAGQNKGAKDTRDILSDLPDMVEACLPEVLVIENVPGLVTNNQNASYLEDLLERLEKPGESGTRYGLAKGILLAADYGVPQLRKRLFILGFRGKSHTYASKVLKLIEKEATHCNPNKPVPDRKPWIILAEAFRNLPDPGGWRQFQRSDTDDIKDNVTNQTSVSKLDSTNIKENESVFKVIEIDPVTDFPISGMNRIQLHWPGKGEKPLIREGKWETMPHRNMLSRHPLLEQVSTSRKMSDQEHLAIVGNQFEALRALRVYVSASLDLIYFEPYRVELLPVTMPGLVNSVWMSIIRETVLQCIPLLAPSGMIVLHVNDRSYHYARSIMEEVFGPRSYVCTIVWQKKYGPQNDSNVPTDAQDYLIVFSKHVAAELPIIGLPTSDDLIDDDDPRGPWRAGHKGARSGTEESKFEVNAPPYRWRVVEGDFPPGLWRLNEFSGVIWGTPEQSGDFSFRIAVSDASVETATRKITISIQDEGIPVCPENVWWLFKDSSTITSEDKLKIRAQSKIIGVIGKPFAVIFAASGGKPYTGNKTMPGSGRYWEFNRSTLVREILADNVHFGANGNALPSVKKHTPVGETRNIRVITWWPYKVAGKAEDATRHLKQLAERGMLKEPPRISKPELLLKRIIQLFAKDSAASVASIGDSTGSFTSAAIKLGKRTIHLAGSLPNEVMTWQDSGKPRIEAVLRGEDDLGISNDEDVQWKGGGSLRVFAVGPEFMSYSADGERIRINLTDFTPSSPRFSEAICSLLGFYWDASRSPKGYNDSGDLCVMLSHDEVLTEMKLSQLVSDFVSNTTHLTIAFERSNLPENTVTHENVRLVRIPFDLTD